MFDFLIVLLLMFFFHIVDDFYLQGILAKLKQKSFWEENAPNKMYRHDYIVALIEHAFSWCVSIHIPIFVMWYFVGGFSIIAFALNFIAQIALHAIVDNLKANKMKINLIEDQLLHLIQISFTLALYMIVR